MAFPKLLCVLKHTGLLFVKFLFVCQAISFEKETPRLDPEYHKHPETCDSANKYSMLYSTILNY